MADVMIIGAQVRSPQRRGAEKAEALLFCQLIVGLPDSMVSRLLLWFGVWRDSQDCNLKPLFSAFFDAFNNPVNVGDYCFGAISLRMVVGADHWHNSIGLCEVGN